MSSEELLKRLYYAPDGTGSLGGINRLYSHARSIDSTISRKDVVNFLKSQDSYTLHKGRRYKFKRNQYKLKGKDDLWQSDLAQLDNISKHNDGVKYLVIVIDCLSKYMWVEPVKSKKAADVLDAIQTIFQRATPRRPENFMVDKGSEYKNRFLMTWMKEQGVNFYTTNNPDTKCAIAERSIRTLKSRIFRYFTAKNTWRYIDVLPKIVESYNNSYHRTIRMAPSAVVGPEEVAKIKRLLYPPKVAHKPQFKYSVGESVRLAKERGAFDKGYKKGWTEEIFYISRCISRDPPVYEVKDAAGNSVEGTFYAYELQSVIKEDDVYKVEKILDTRQIGRKTQYLVKWLGYPESMSSWEPEENIVLL